MPWVRRAAAWLVRRDWRWIATWSLIIGMTVGCVSLGILARKFFGTNPTGVIEVWIAILLGLPAGAIAIHRGLRKPPKPPPGGWRDWPPN
jgi:hypothetical protein